jgi:hypothetical protein
MPSSSSNVYTHIISVVAFAIALYSTSVLDIEMVGCFQALHDTRLDPRKTANPPSTAYHPGTWPNQHPKIHVHLMMETSIFIVQDQ